ncbi:MAG: mechanosensitive ion channel [Anaerolineae bacterium]|nr:mechanosensitive ion channel [Anaerolineae bacterium]
MFEFIQDYLSENPVMRLPIAGLIILISYFIANRFVVNLIIAFVGRTEQKTDDIIVQHIKPRRTALLVPLLLTNAFAYLIPAAQQTIQVGVLFVALWLGVVTVNALLNACNDIYEHRESFKGGSIKSYLDIVKLLVVIMGFILSISLITGKDVTGILTGLGAATAVLLLIFRDTLLSLVASFQISTNDLLRVGDWLEVPSFNADGDVIDISLHQVKIQNWDKTISVVPTYKFMEVAYKNWRGMSDSGGRRIKRALYIDIASIHFCDDEMIERFKQFDLIQDYIEQALARIEKWNKEQGLDPNVLANSRGLTNIGTFRAYIVRYLQSHPQIRNDMTLIVRQLSPGSTGLPIEIYAFTNTTAWEEYETIQANIFDHLLAVVPQFDLRIFQEPTGNDLSSFARSSR